MTIAKSHTATLTIRRVGRAESASIQWPLRLPASIWSNTGRISLRTARAITKMSMATSRSGIARRTLPPTVMAIPRMYSSICSPQGRV